MPIQKCPFTFCPISICPVSICPLSNCCLSRMQYFHLFSDCEILNSEIMKRSQLSGKLSQFCHYL